MLNRPLRILLREILNQSFFLISVLLVFPIYFFYKLFTPKKKIWLIGENGGDYLGDNSYFFYLYCCSKKLKHDCYFITNKKSIKNNLHLQKNTNIINFGSFQHIMMFLLSDVIIFSHSHSDIAYINILRIFNRRCKKIFLQHGVIAFKQIHSTYRAHHNEMDLFVVSSLLEKRLVEKNFCFAPQTIAITGLARYDSLESKSSNSQRNILFFPTWRDWSFPDAIISNYTTTIKNLLSSRILSDMLEEHNIILTYYPHSSFRKVITDTPVHNNIKIVTTEQQILQELIKSHSLLITDYSSVAWDFLYQNKPVIFYQFDQDEYNKFKGAYIDFNKDLFGDVCKKENELLLRLEQMILNGFTPSLESQIRRKASFDHYDQDNRSRIYHSIIALEK